MRVDLHAAVNLVVDVDVVVPGARATTGLHAGSTVATVVPRRLPHAVTFRTPAAAGDLTDVVGVSRTNSASSTTTATV